jgi:hypothetical protein
MNSSTIQKIQLEFLWWVVTALITGGLLYPIYQSGAIYPFWIQNIVFILVFITLVRYLFLLKFTLLSHFQIGKAIIFVFCVPLFLYLFNQMAYFQVFLGETGMQEVFKDLSMDQQSALANYTKNEMIFFGTGSIIACLIFPVRILISFWRTHNRGTV